MAGILKHVPEHHQRDVDCVGNHHSKAIRRIWDGRFWAAPRWTGRRLQHYFSTLSTGGLIMGIIFFCFSMTPSLLPRTWYLQGLASGICIITGYAFGTFIAVLLRRFGFRPLHQPHQRRIIRRMVFISMAVTVPIMGILGAIWQYRVRELIGADLDDPNYYALTLLIAFLFARLSLSVVRLLRAAVRRLGRWGARWIPLPVAKLIATVLVTTLVITIVSDTLLPPIVRAANSSFALTDTGNFAGITPPVESQRSGSPTSLVAWDDLGKEGRSFVARGPRAADITAFSGRDASEPIRAYAGADSAPTVTGAADLVVEELRRMGGFERAVIAIATTTGRGWVNEIAAETLEYMWDGDTAIAAVQYSYLPSPVAFVADRTTPPEAARALYEAITAELVQLPADQRPQLMLMGESLGAYGSQGIFDSINDVVDAVDAALWVGSPNFTPLWQQLTTRRQAGSPEQRPQIHACREVCFMTKPSDIPPGAHPTVIMMQHTNDPIVWWSPRLLFSEPDWLKESPLPGRSAAMRWIPLVTFWQVTMDMIFSTEMPDGTGHHYGLNIVDAMAAILAPETWTPAATLRLRAALADVSVS